MGTEGLASGSRAVEMCPAYLPRRQQDIERLLRELEVTRSWQIHVQRVAELPRAPTPVSDVEGILERLLLLDDVAITVVRVLEEARGEGLAGYSSMDAGRGAR